MTAANEALVRLREGNRRFVVGQRQDANAYTLPPVGEQSPFAIVLGCSDSRVPAEIVFDQSLGDLFVIRVAGNIVAPSQVGSVEFAVTQFGVRLVVVMGHTACGAVRATLDELVQPSEDLSPNLRSIVDRIQPGVEPLINQPLPSDERLARAVRANISASADHLRKGSEILKDFTEHEDLVVVGAEYSLATGVVEFFDGVPG